MRSQEGRDTGPRDGPRIDEAKDVSCTKSWRDLRLAVFFRAASWISGPRFFFLMMEIHSSPNRADVGAILAGTAPKEM